MNRRAAASVRAIRRALPFEPPGMLLLFSVFGSQVRGTETARSDLDVLYVTCSKSRPFYNSVRRTVLEAPGGVKTVSIFDHTPQTIKKFANLYGTVEYGVLRGIGGVKTLYKSESADLGGIMGKSSEADNNWCAKQWMKLSEGIIFHKRENGPQPPPGLVCFLMRQSIDYLLRACLLSADIRFPFTRDVGELYEMLPPERRMSLDLDALARWAKYADGVDGQSYTDDDAAAATDMAEKAHAFTRDVVVTPCAS